MFDIPRLYLTACSMIMFSLYHSINYHVYIVSPLQTANATEGPGNKKSSRPRKLLLSRGREFKSPRVHFF